MASWMLAVVLVGRIVVDASFDRPDGPLPSAWTATRSGWGIVSEQVHPPQVRDVSEVVRRVGPSRGLTVSADVRLSGTALRANAGLAFMWRSHRNHLFCKAEVTEGNPTGLVSIGRTLDGRVASLLASRSGMGLQEGATYRMRMRRVGNTVSCSIASGGLASVVRVRYELTLADLERLGSAGKSGFRVKVEFDEDDGGSRFDNFLARR